MRLFLLVIILMFTSAVSAQEIDGCGHVDGNVSPYDSTICKQDKAFNILSGLFPEVYREVAEINQLDEIASDEIDEMKRREGYNRANTVFTNLYANFFEIAKWLLVIYAAFFSLDLIARYVKNGDLTQNGRYKPSRMVAGGMSSAFLLIPYKTFFMAQIIVFCFSLASLGLANLIHSTFISAQQERIEEQWEHTLTAQADGTVISEENLSYPAFKEDRHNHLARKFYEHLVLTEICRKQSADYLLKGVADQLPSSEVESYRNCFYGIDSKPNLLNSRVDWNNKVSSSDYPSFISLGMSSEGNFQSSAGEVFSYHSVLFELEPNKSPQCELSNYEVPFYQCGEIKFYEPNWEQSPYTSIVGGDFLKNVLSDLVMSISPSSTPNEVSSIARSGWSKLATKIDQEIGNWSESEINAPLSLNELNVSDFNDYMREANELEDKKKILYAKNSNGIRQFASFYYRSVMNALMFGRVSAIHDDDRIQVETKSEYAALQYHMNKIRPIAKLVEEANCGITPHNLANSIKGLEYISSAGDVPPESVMSFRCVDWDSKEVLGHWDDIGGVDENERRKAIIQRYDALVLEYEKEMKAAYIELANLRKSVETAFIEDSKNLRGENIWVTMRQEGFLSMAEYAYVMNDEYQTVRDQIQYITNNYSLEGGSTDLQMLSRSLKYNGRTEGLTYPYFDEGKAVMRYLDDQFRSIDPFVSRASFIQSKMALHNKEVYDSDFISSILRSLGDVWSITSDFESFGMSSLKLYQEGTKEACMADVSKCPFPTRDPFIQLNQYGHSIVNAANSYIIAVAAGKVMSALIQKASTYGSDSGGDIKKQKVIDKLKTKAYAAATKMVLVDIITELSGKIIDATLVLVLMMWVLGVALAYLLPLIPFLFVYFGFAAWVLIVFLTSFATFIFSVYLIRFNEKREEITRSAIHYAGQILFRLPLQYVSLVFAWYFFYAVSYFIANTIGLANEGISAGSNGGLFSFIYEIFEWITVAFVFFFGIKMSYDVVEDLTGELMKKLGVDHQASKDKVNDVIKAALFDQVQEAADNVGSKATKKKPSKERKAYNDALRKLQEQQGQGGSQ